MYTLKSLLEQYPVVIPMIQRDYAQGRTTGHAPRVRKSILQKLKQATVNAAPLDFDFIYGSLKDNTPILHPLDGQQRLTTLYLLYWYIGHRKGTIPTYLKDFTYETRISARDFFHALCTECIVETKDDISQMIQHQKWFRPSWLQDPTIQGALIMLNDLEKTFRDVEATALPDLNQQEPAVSFQFLDLNTYDLDETLYIKMNSRGKPLSQFEHFKAQFEQMLVGRGWTSLAKTFSQRVEKEWTDLLWPFRNSKTHTIDEAFLHYYRFVTSSIALHHQSIPSDGKQTKYMENLTLPETFYIIYDTPEKVETLFKAFDLWTDAIHLKQTFDEYCHSIPLLASSIGERLLQGNLTNEEHLLVYAILRIELSKSILMPDRVHRIYVLRNIIEGIRQGNQGIYNSNLRFSMFEELYQDIDCFVSAPNVYQGLSQLKHPSIADYVIAHEQEKQLYRESHSSYANALTRLENHYILRGMTFRVFPAFKDFGLAFVQVFEDLQATSQALVTRSLLACGEYELTIGHSNLGKRRLFGGEKYAPFVWTYQVGNSQKEQTIKVQTVFDLFFKRIMQKNATSSIQTRLQEIVQDYLQTSSSTKDWRHHFVASTRILTDRGDVFAWTAPERFVIERLRGVSLQSDHINPFYLDLVKQTNLSDDLLQYTYYHEFSSIEVQKGTSLSLTTSGWDVISDKLSADEAIDLLNNSPQPHLLVEGNDLIQILKTI